MGEAKRRQATNNVVYHHTSVLRTNLIWMSRLIQVEGQGKGPVFHPGLDKFRYGGADVLIRRPLKDFPAVAWFTTRITTPKCLTQIALINSETGEKIHQATEKEAHCLAWNRIALGFPITNQFVPWPQYYGYETQEGRDLNESAREYGDDPADWYVSETPVDVMNAIEVWGSRSVMKPKLERNQAYLKDIHRMVMLCRDNPDAYIPPSWLTEDQAKGLFAGRNVPFVDVSAAP
jgi:hypothetical protein